jgi:hypothetical protein
MKINPTTMPKHYEIAPSQVFSELATKKTQEEKIAFLKKNEDFTLLSILQAGFSKSIVFDLPEGSPPFKAYNRPIGTTPSRLRNAVIAMARLVKSVRTQRTPALRRENQFIQILESIPASEAKVLIAVKDKNITELYPEMTAELALAAFPKLYKEEDRKAIEAGMFRPKVEEAKDDELLDIEVRLVDEDELPETNEDLQQISVELDDEEKPKKRGRRKKKVVDTED